MFYLKGFGKYPKGPQLHEKTLATKKTYKIPDNSLKKEHSKSKLDEWLYISQTIMKY
jgi:hypothetical protein